MSLSSILPKFYALQQKSAQSKSYDKFFKFFEKYYYTTEGDDIIVRICVPVQKVHVDLF